MCRIVFAATRDTQCIFRFDSNALAFLVCLNISCSSWIIEFEVSAELDIRPKGVSCEWLDNPGLQPVQAYNYVESIKYQVGLFHFIFQTCYNIVRKPFCTTLVHVTVYVYLNVQNAVRPFIHVPTRWHSYTICNTKNKQTNKQTNKQR